MSSGASKKRFLQSNTQTLQSLYVEEVSKDEAGLVYQLDSSGRIWHLGSGMADILGIDPDTAIGGKVYKTVHKDDRAALEAAIGTVFEHRDRRLTIEFRTKGSDGHWVHLEATVLFSARFGPPRAMLVARDVTSRKRKEAKAKRKVQWFQSLTRYSRDVITVFDKEWACLFASGSAKTILGFSPKDLTWSVFVNSFHAEDRERVLESFASAARTVGSARTVEYRMRHPSGRVMYVESHAVNSTENPAIRGFVIYTRDITDRKTLDPVTKLPNRTYLLEQLRELSEKLKTGHPPFGLMVFEMAQLHTLQAGLTRADSDDFLWEVALRLEKHIGDLGSLVRLDGERFAILSAQVPRKLSLSRLAESLKKGLTHPFRTPNGQIYLSAAVGLVIADKGLANGDEILQAAMTALQIAKSHGGAKHVVYNSAMSKHVMTRIGIENDLRTAISRGEFKLHYEPLMNSVDLTVSGFEALIRWPHATRGMVSPGVFIPIAEQTGLMADIGRWVIEEACMQLAEWTETAPEARDLKLHVNLSPEQIQDGELIGVVQRAIDSTGANPKQLVFELTETAFMKSPDEVAATLAGLKEMGCGLALDDFGTGYSSLSYLHQFPFDVLKVDQSFVRHLGGDGDPRNRMLVKTMVELGHSLGMGVVAEGVETEVQLEALQELDCELLQGWYFSRSLPAEDALLLFHDPTPPLPEEPLPELKSSAAARRPIRRGLGVKAVSSVKRGTALAGKRKSPRRS